MARRDNIVSDHAVLRYLERVYGVDIAALKRRIELTTRAARNQGASGVISDGVRYALSASGRVTTVHGCNSPVSKRARRWRARRK